jgi:hypothetical protein
MTIWEWFNEITTSKRPWSSLSKEDQDTFNPFMLNRVVSMYEPYIELSNYIQKLWALSHEQIYTIYCEYLPKQKIYAKYIKNEKKKEDKDLKLILAKYFQISHREIEDYLVILNEKEIVDTLYSLGIEEEIIHKFYRLPNKQ